jgi:hypothetical protein
MANPKGYPATLRPGQGRPKGSKNKFTLLKNAFLEAFEEIGGKDALVKWAEQNRGKFYEFLVRLFPKELKAELRAAEFEVPEVSEEEEEELKAFVEFTIQKELAKARYGEGVELEVVFQPKQLPEPLKLLTEGGEWESYED